MKIFLKDKQNIKILYISLQYLLGPMQQERVKV